MARRTSGAPWDGAGWGDRDSVRTTARGQGPAGVIRVNEEKGSGS